MLTARENQVALLVSRGLSNKEVARELGVSGGTVKLQVHNILQKLEPAQSETEPKPEE